ncbi:hypothetical protein AB4Z21_00915 [Paenibacillus sp. MCAF20]
MRIQRMNEAELDAAIGDLLKRGFKLLSRGTSGYPISEVRYVPSSLRPFKNRGTSLHRQHWAILRREDEA